MADFDIKEVKSDVIKTVKKNPKLWAGAAAGVILLGLYAATRQDNAGVAYYEGYPQLTDETAPGETGPADLPAELLELLRDMVSYDDFMRFIGEQDISAAERDAAIISIIEANRADILGQFEAQQPDYYQQIEDFFAPIVQEQASYIPAGGYDTGLIDINDFGEYLIQYGADGSITRIDDVEGFYAKQPEWVRETREKGKQEISRALEVAADTTKTPAQKAAYVGLSQTDIDTQMNMIRQDPSISFGARDIRNFGYEVTSGASGSKSSSGNKSSSGSKSSGGGASSGSKSSGGGASSGSSSSNSKTIGSHTYTKNKDGSVTKTTASTGRTVTVPAGSKDMKFIPKSAGGTGAG